MIMKSTKGSVFFSFMFLLLTVMFFYSCNTRKHHCNDCPTFGKQNKAHEPIALAITR
jgi:hypothetical protein